MRQRPHASAANAETPACASYAQRQFRCSSFLWRRQRFSEATTWSRTQLRIGLKIELGVGLKTESRIAQPRPDLAQKHHRTKRQEPGIELSRRQPTDDGSTLFSIIVFFAQSSKLHSKCVAGALAREVRVITSPHDKSLGKAPLQNGRSASATDWAGTFTLSARTNGSQE
jgi:hypothetical protein